MPYIKKNNRKKFKELLEVYVAPLLTKFLAFPDLFLYKVLELYLETIGENYANHNEIMGVLTCSYKEYVRRWNDKSDIYHVYVTSGDSNEFDDVIAYMKTFKIITNCGELNYFITKVMLLLKVNGTENSQINVLYESLADRWYKEKVAPYEDKKIRTNGDI